MTSIRHLAIMIMGALPLTGLSQVYSWKDATGKTHYGDRPPTEQQAGSRKLAAPPVETADAIAARKAAAERLLSEREKQQKNQADTGKSQESPAQGKQRAEGCRQAKANLAAIESGQVRFTVDAKGERTGLDGQLRDAEIAKARMAVDSWCAPSRPAAK